MPNPDIRLVPHRRPPREELNLHFCIQREPSERLYWSLRKPSSSHGSSPPSSGGSLVSPVLPPGPVQSAGGLSGGAGSVAGAAGAAGGAGSALRRASSA